MSKSSEDPRWTTATESSRRFLLDKYRYVNTEHDWWDFADSSFKENMSEIGIEVSNIYFSVAYCQSDHAVFEGRVVDWAKMLRHLGLLLKYDRYMNDTELSFRSTAKRSSMSFDWDTFICEDEQPDHPLRRLLWEMEHVTYDELNDLMDDVSEVFKNQAGNLYKALESEIEHLTSDETVIEFILEHADDELETEDEDDC